jgi:hypothetical protein
LLDLLFGAFAPRLSLLQDLRNQIPFLPFVCKLSLQISSGFKGSYWLSSPKTVDFPIFSFQGARLQKV